jgi:phosphonoacetate hydrolase
VTRVVIAAFDGLQMWQIDPSVMPNLDRFASQGVRFERHHAVVPSVTRLNATSMVTGCLPGSHGIAGNRMLFRDVWPNKIADVLEPELRLIKQESGNRVLLKPTLAERLSREGMEYAAVVSGTSGNAFCHVPNADISRGLVIHPEFSLPDDINPLIEQRFGAWPEAVLPNAPLIAHATDIFLDYVYGERKSDVGLIWYAEPDKSQHATGVSSDTSIAALRAADHEFGRLLNAISDDTNVFVISDHGYSMSEGIIEIESMLGAQGYSSLGESGGVGVAANGGTALIYGDELRNGQAESIVDWLVDQPWCGSIFASERIGAIDGTLPMSLIGMEGIRSADLAVATNWSAADGPESVAHSNTFGTMMQGHGDHGGLSPTEMRNTLIARGPAFKSGVASDLPSGNIDLTPTVLSVLGIDGDGMDGRVLAEAFSGESDASANGEPEYRTHEAIRGEYRQVLQTVEYAGVSYVEQANRV